MAVSRSGRDFGQKHTNAMLKDTCKLKASHFKHSEYEYPIHHPSTSGYILLMYLL